MAELRDLPYADVHPNPGQDRKHFDPVELRELADSIREQGLIQAPTVRPDPAGGFELVAGERRWRAVGLLGWKTIQCVVRVMTDEERDDAMTIENLQRVDLTALEEAGAYQRRLDQGTPLDDLARRLGVTKQRIRERTALLNLLPEYRELFEKGQLGQNEANKLSWLKPDFQRLLFQAISEGRCKTWHQLRAVAEKLKAAQDRNDVGGASAVTLAPMLDGEQRSMFADPVTPAERERLSTWEKKLQAVMECVAEGFDENEAIVVTKIRKGKAAHAAQELEILEWHIRKLKIALLKEAATSGVAA